MVKMPVPPYFSLTSANFSADSFMASSQLMRSQPGSSPLGRVRFMG